MENTEILHHHNEGQTPPDTPRSPGLVDKMKKVDDISVDQHSLQAPVAEMAKTTLDDKGKTT